MRTCPHMSVPFRTCACAEILDISMWWCGEVRKFKKYVPHPHHESPQNVPKNKKKSSKNGNMYFKNDLHIITVWERAQFCFPILYIYVWCGAGADKVKWCGVGCGADFFDELWCAVRYGIRKFWEMLFTNILAFTYRVRKLNLHPPKMTHIGCWNCNL